MKIFTYTSFKSHSFFGLLLACVLLFLFSACSGPKTVQVSVQGAMEMNQKQACVIYIYQLSIETYFMGATSDTFWSKADQPFEGLVGDPIRIQLFPGEAKPLELNISEETRFIGAAADFYKTKNGGWRRVVSIASKVPKIITVLIKNDSIEIIE